MILHYRVDVFIINTSSLTFRLIFSIILRTVDTDYRLSSVNVVLASFDRKRLGLLNGIVYLNPCYCFDRPVIKCCFINIVLITYLVLIKPLNVFLKDFEVNNLNFF